MCLSRPTTRGRNDERKGNDAAYGAGAQTYGRWLAQSRAMDGGKGSAAEGECVPGWIRAARRKGVIRRTRTIPVRRRNGREDHPEAREIQDCWLGRDHSRD